jgi:hypothetical protein
VPLEHNQTAKLKQQVPLVEQELLTLSGYLSSPTHNIPLSTIKEKFEDAKGVIRIRISKKDRQHNDKTKKYKKTNNDLQTIHIKLKIE